MIRKGERRCSGLHLVQFVEVAVSQRLTNNFHTRMKCSELAARYVGSFEDQKEPLTMGVVEDIVSIDNCGFSTTKTSFSET